MHFRFFFSTPQGDKELAPKDLAQPFLLNPDKKHPFLTLEDYFGALQKFILSDNAKNLQAALVGMQLPNNDSLVNNLSEIIIQSEKHGAFYHIASITPVGLQEKRKLAITTALSDSAKATLKKEYRLIQQLAVKNPEFLPRLFCLGQVPWQAADGTEEFYMMLGEWLTDHHEWHLSHNQAAGRQQIHLWDHDKGYFFLSDSESYELIRQTAIILTSYYDQRSFCQIYPWHHGAGDFIVRVEPQTIAVKLITVRGYQPLICFENAGSYEQLSGAIQFLLNLSLRIRLDRLDGIGEPAWLDSFAVKAAVAGFFSGLLAAANREGLSFKEIETVLEILRTFHIDEICGMYEPLLDIYADEDQDDLQLIKEKLKAHVTDLYSALQKFSLQIN